ncbi:MAG: PDZ domain-containing protein [Bacteriovoracaceae bacterium]|jgi:type II secretory pathway component PulC|nr:PDZ domain-containing protein [Bacteriovoracaceae bacterium]
MNKFIKDIIAKLKSKVSKKNLGDDQTDHDSTAEVPTFQDSDLPDSVKMDETPSEFKEASLDDLLGDDDGDEQSVPSLGTSSGFKKKVSLAMAGVLAFTKKGWSGARAKMAKKTATSLKADNFSAEKLNFAEKLLSTTARPFIHKAFILSSALGMAYGVGKVGGLAMKGRPTPRKLPVQKISAKAQGTRPQINKVRMTNVFRVKLRGNETIQDIKPIINTTLVCDQSSNKSSLPIKLISTVVLQDAIKSVAAVQVRGARDLKSFRQGEKIQNLAKIDKITRLKIIVKNLSSGKCEYIANKEKISQSKYKFNILDKDSGKKLMDSLTPEGIKNDGNNFDVECGFFKDKLKDLGNVLTQARGVPIQNPDGTLSFRIQEVAPDGIFSHLGIQDDDIIRKINKRKINNLNEVMNLFGKIQNMKKFSVTVDRGGIEQSLAYKIGECANKEKKK